MIGRRLLYAASLIVLALCTRDVASPLVASAGGGTAQTVIWPGGLIAYGVSADGSVVVGRGSGFRWTAAGGLQNLGDFGAFGGSTAYSVSADGSVVVGEASAPLSQSHAFRWTVADGMHDLGTFGGIYSAAYSVSADGSVVVGKSDDATGNARPFRWTAATGMQDLGGPNGYALDVSADGSVVVGYAFDVSGNYHPFRWTAAGGMQVLAPFGRAFGVSADGSVVVGEASGNAFRWTAAGGIQNLGTLGGPGGSTAYGVSADGSVVVGDAADPIGAARAFRWTAATGMQNLTTIYTGAIGSGSFFETAYAISANGSTIVGWGYNRQNLRYEAFSAFTPPVCAPLTCLEQGKNCGTISDGCGGTLTCGTCTALQTCGGGGANVCGAAAACTPTTCAAQGKNCGSISNGCGGFIFCGSCTSPQTCGATGIANVCGLGTGAVSVGPFGNGSGRVTSLPVGLDCTLGNGVSTGTCRAFFPVGTVVNLNAVPAPGSSFIGFIPNKALCPASVTVPAACQVGFVLNCTPTSCFAQGKNCGTISDGCGATLTCGVCTAPQTCGGGGVLNVCGVASACTPTTCAAQGKNCGTISDGCGGTLTCGVCTAPQTCGGAFVANVCGVASACAPTTCAVQGKNCGTISDGCGGTLTCGVCTAPQTCGGGGLANVCGASTVSTTLLTLTATGRTGESVSSSPIGLKVNVGTTGSASFATGTVVTLSVSNGRDAIWSGGCPSGGAKVKTCSFTINAATSVTANVQ